MSEPVRTRCLCLGHERSVGIMQSFRNGNKHISLLLHDLGDIFRELVKVKVSLGKVNKIRTAAVSVFGRKRGRCREPAGMSAHYFNDGDHISIVNVGVLADFHA